MSVELGDKLSGDWSTEIEIISNDENDKMFTDNYNSQHALKMAILLTILNCNEIGMILLQLPPDILVHYCVLTLLYKCQLKLSFINVYLVVGIVAQSSLHTPELVSFHCLASNIHLPCYRISVKLLYAWIWKSWTKFRH